MAEVALQNLNGHFGRIECGAANLIAAVRFADFGTSIEVRREATINGARVAMRGVTISDLSMIIGNAPVVRELTDNGTRWTTFWMDGIGPGEEHGVYTAGHHTYDPKTGRFTPGKGDPDLTAHVTPGTRTPRLFIDSDEGTGWTGRRYVVNTSIDTSETGLMVVGIEHIAALARPE